MYQWLKSGERPYQPDICSAEVWKVMGCCWLPDYNHRPTFKELVTTFEKFRQNPRLYISTTEHGLPTYTHQDNKDWLYSLKAEEGPEQLMEAEDYLQLGSRRAPSDNGSLILNNNNAMFRQITLNSCSRLPSCGSNNGSLPPTTPIKKDGQNFFELNMVGGMNNPMATNSAFLNPGAFLTIGNKQNVAYNRFNNGQNSIQTGLAFNFNTNNPHQITTTFHNRSTSRSLDDSLDNTKLISTPTTITSNLGPDFSMIQYGGSKNNSSSSAADFRKYSQNSTDSTIGHYNNCNNLNHVREGSMNSNKYSIDQLKNHHNQDLDNLDSVFLPNNATYPLQQSIGRNHLDSDDYLTPLTAVPTNIYHHRPTNYFTNSKFVFYLDLNILYKIWSIYFFFSLSLIF